MICPREKIWIKQTQICLICQLKFEIKNYTLFTDNFFLFHRQVNINPAYTVDDLEFALLKVGVSCLVMAEGQKDSDYYDMLFELCPELATCPPGRLHSKRFVSELAVTFFLLFVWIQRYWSIQLGGCKICNIFLNFDTILVNLLHASDIIVLLLFSQSISSF